MSVGVTPTQPSGKNGEDKNRQGDSDCKVNPELIRNAYMMVIVLVDDSGGGLGIRIRIRTRVRVGSESEAEKPHAKQRADKCGR